MTLTPWFPASIKPVRKGWYEVRNRKNLHWNAKGRLTGRSTRYWTGRRWLTEEPKHPWSECSVFGTHPEHEWRGLAEAPAKGQP